VTVAVPVQARRNPEFNMLALLGTILAFPTCGFQKHSAIFIAQIGVQTKRQEDAHHNPSFRFQ
jgi:hypothetical protein